MRPDEPHPPPGTRSRLQQPSGRGCICRRARRSATNSSRSRRSTETACTPLPTSYASAEQINPYQLLINLHDHAITRPAEPSSTDLLAELALAAALVTWWRRWQPAMIHAALRASAGIADITAVTGLDPAEGRRPVAPLGDGPDRRGHQRHPLLDPDE